MADLIKLYCEIAETVGPEDILISTGENFNAAAVNQPQVRSIDYLFVSDFSRHITYLFCFVCGIFRNGTTFCNI